MKALLFILLAVPVFAADNLTLEAEELFRTIREQVYPEAEKIIAAANYDNETGVITFMPVSENVATLAEMRTDERLYIFISKSVPADVLKRYASDIDRLGIGHSAVFVIRGCIDSGYGVGGCGDFRPTLDFIKSFSMNEKDEMKSVQIWLDPLLFRKYHITDVPAVVYAKNVEYAGALDIGSEGLDDNLKSPPIYRKSTGDWTLEYHMKEVGK